MKHRFIPLLLALCMVLVQIPAIPAAAAGVGRSSGVKIEFARDKWMPSEAVAATIYSADFYGGKVRSISVGAVGKENRAVFSYNRYAGTITASGAGIADFYSVDDTTFDFKFFFNDIDFNDPGVYSMFALVTYNTTWNEAENRYNTRSETIELPDINIMPDKLEAGTIYSEKSVYQEGEAVTLIVTRVSNGLLKRGNGYYTPMVYIVDEGTEYNPLSTLDYGAVSGDIVYKAKLNDRSVAAGDGMWTLNAGTIPSGSYDVWYFVHDMVRSVDYTTGEINYPVKNDLEFDTRVVSLRLSVEPFVNVAPTPALDSEQPSEWAVDVVEEGINVNLVPSHLRSKYTQAITRAEFCALAVKLYEYMVGTIDGRRTFYDCTDVNVLKCASIGVVNGLSEDGNLFYPDNQLTREQAATMLARLSKAIREILPKEDPTFDDNDLIADYAYEAVGQMQHNGIMSGDNNLFDPKGNYTREQSIATMVRLMDVINTLFPNPRG